MLRKTGVNIELTCVQATAISIAMTISIAMVISIGLLNLC